MLDKPLLDGHWAIGAVGAVMVKPGRCRSLWRPPDSAASPLQDGVRAAQSHTFAPLFRRDARQTTFYHLKTPARGSRREPKPGLLGDAAPALATAGT